MRTIAALLLVCSLATPAVGRDGDYCVIPMLVRGQPTTVEVPYIDKPFCGVALIDNHYVRLSEIAKAKDEEPAACASEALCTRTSRYYLDEERRSEPFIIIFQGPKRPDPA